TPSRPNETGCGGRSWWNTWRPSLPNSRPCPQASTPRLSARCSATPPTPATWRRPREVICASTGPGLRDEERLDGKYLLRTSDDTLSAEDVALGYKQLIEVESAFRTLKSTLDLRPVYHRIDDRIRSHVLLCWLALLLVRLVEIRTQRTWPAVRDMLQTMHLGKFVADRAEVYQRTETTRQQAEIFSALKIDPPPEIVRIETDNPETA